MSELYASMSELEKTTIYNYIKKDALQSIFL